jgi:hypothetical protein
VDSSLDELRRLLEEVGIELVLIGAHAANRYRVEVRHTLDVDWLASSLDGAEELLKAQGWAVRAVSDDGVVYMVSARRGATVVDLLLAETEYQRVAMRRAVNGVLTVEDVIVHKLIAGRPRDLDDIASILAARVPLDEAYIAEHATAWSVLERWLQQRGQ